MTFIKEFCETHSNAPLLLFLAGPNGAGKSTFYDMFLASLRFTFINADVIAQGLSPTKHDATLSTDQLAFAQAEKQRQTACLSQQSFCTETVFSDPKGAKLAYLREAREKYGYLTTLVFIGIAAELSKTRVMQRVARGGHDIPHEKLIKRYPRTMSNLKAALLLVDVAFVIDNSSILEPYRLVARYEGSCLVQQNYIPPWAAQLPGL